MSALKHHAKPTLSRNMIDKMSWWALILLLMAKSILIIFRASVADLVRLNLEDPQQATSLSVARGCLRHFRTNVDLQPPPACSAFLHLPISGPAWHSQPSFNSVEKNTEPNTLPGIVLSKMKATDPPTNMAVVRSTFNTWSISTMPEKYEERLGVKNQTKDLFISLRWDWNFVERELFHLPVTSGFCLR